MAATTIALGTGSNGIGTRTLTFTGTDTSAASPNNLLGVSGVTDSPPIWSNANSPMVDQVVTLASGDNTVNVPTTAAWVEIIPPTNSAVAKTFRITGSTGQSFSPTAGLKWAFTATPPASFIINAGSAETVLVRFG